MERTSLEFETLCLTDLRLQNTLPMLSLAGRHADGEGIYSYKEISLNLERVSSNIHHGRVYSAAICFLFINSRERSFLGIRNFSDSGETSSSHVHISGQRCRNEF